MNFAYALSMPKIKVYLFGQSMLLSIVADNLMQCPNLQVIHETKWEGITTQLIHGPPNVLIYDLDCTAENQILPLLYQDPGLLLIGLDVETNRAMLIAGQEKTSLTLERMKEIVEKTLQVK